MSSYLGREIPEIVELHGTHAIVGQVRASANRRSFDQIGISTERTQSISSASVQKMDPRGEDES